MKEKYFVTSSVRVMRYLYALGFEKESFATKDGRESWRFELSDRLFESLDFYKKMRELNRK